MYLKQIASHVVDKYVIDKSRNQQILEHVQQIEKSEANASANTDGRYPCRARGCNKTFAHDGKLRKHHVESFSLNSFVINSNQCEEDRDDMLAYQKALLDYGMLILNFWDAIAEGDEERIFRCLKYFLMYLKHQGRSSTKYALEGLYFMFQVQALLSPRAAHRLVWNRSVKNKRGSSNIPLDLMLEFYNRIIKEAVKKLGPGASAKSLDRISNSLGFTSDLMKVFDSSMSVFKRSGKHVKSSSKNDTEKIVNSLVENRAFTFTSGRMYKSYAHVKPSIISGFNLQQLYQWINEHKKFMIFYRRAR